MADTFTTYYNLTKPQVGGDPDTWGGLLNANFDAIDTGMNNAQTTANNAMPKTGGTFTGAIGVNYNNPGGISIGGTSANSIGLQLSNSVSGGHSWAIASSGSASLGGVGALAIYDNTASALRAYLDTSGNLTMAGGATFGGTMQANSITCGTDQLLLYEGSTGVLNVRSGTSGAGYRFFGFGSDGTFNISNGGLSVNNNPIFGNGNSTETDINIARSGVNKFYLAVNSSDQFAICRTNPSTGAFAESVFAIGQTGNLSFSRTCQAPDFVATSDARLKDIIGPLKAGYAELKKLQPMRYIKYDDLAHSGEGKEEVGFIAQKVREVLPTAVTENDVLAVSPMQLLALVVNAVLQMGRALELEGIL